MRITRCAKCFIGKTPDDSLLKTASQIPMSARQLILLSELPWLSLSLLPLYPASFTGGCWFCCCFTMRVVVLTYQLPPRINYFAKQHQLARANLILRLTDCGSRGHVSRTIEWDLRENKHSLFDSLQDWFETQYAVIKTWLTDEQCAGICYKFSFASVCHTHTRNVHSP